MQPRLLRHLKMPCRTSFASPRRHGIRNVAWAALANACAHPSLARRAKELGLAKSNPRRKLAEIFEPCVGLFDAALSARWSIPVSDRGVVFMRRDALTRLDESGPSSAGGGLRREMYGSLFFRFKWRMSTSIMLRYPVLFKAIGLITLALFVFYRCT